jgi:hypothetical protein
LDVTGVASKQEEQNVMSGESSSTIVIIFLVLVGLLCLWTGSTTFISAWNARNWPVAKGTILDSSLEEKWDSEGTSLIPHLHYEYHVGGQRYVSSRITLAQQSLFKDKWSAAVIQRFPCDSSVDVYYDPSRPWEAAIFVGVTPVSSGQPIMGFFMLIAAIMMYVRQRKREGVK